MPLDKVHGIYVVNLRRRPDRLAEFFSRNNLGRSDVHVFEAVDGEDIPHWSPALEMMFSRPKHLMSRGEVACAMSHLALWQHIATFASSSLSQAEGESALHLIMEDDARFIPNAIRLWNTMYAPSVPPNTSVIFLGGFLNIKDTLQPHALPMWGPFRQFIKQFTPTMMVPPHGGHDFLFSGLSYALTPRAAVYLTQFVALNTIRVPIDHYLLLLMAPPHMAYETARSLVSLPPVKAGTVIGADSDVQGSGLIPGGPGTPDYFCIWKLNCIATPVSGSELIATANMSVILPIGPLTIIVHSVLYDGNASSPPLGGVAERSIEKLGLNYTVFSRVVPTALNTDRLRKLGFLGMTPPTQPTASSPERTAMDLSYLALFDAIHSANKPYYLIVEASQELESRHIRAVRNMESTALMMGLEQVDVLFLDCPDPCFDPGAHITPVSPLSVCCRRMPVSLLLTASRSAQIPTALFSSSSMLRSRAF